jgi:hypothetical protein
MSAVSVREGVTLWKLKACGELMDGRGGYSSKGEPNLDRHLRSRCAAEDAIDRRSTDPQALGNLRAADTLGR